MILPVSKLEPGLELARDVTNINGMVLLAAGTQLTPQFIRTLKMWGVETVNVVGEEAESAAEGQGPQFPPEILEAAAASVNRRWKHALSEESVIKTLKDVATKEAAQRMLKSS